MTSFRPMQMGRFYFIITLLSNLKKNNKIRVAVLMGGPSAEHEISLKSGRMVARGLDRKKYSVKTVKISKRGKWPIIPSEIKKQFDVVFIAMHGEYGEDGTVQRIFSKYNIPFTGSGTKASQIGIDKVKASVLFEEKGLAVPDFAVMGGAKKFMFDFPIVVKPADRGSSVGVSIVRDIRELPAALKEAEKYSKRVMVQKFIKGRELTCGVLEIDGRPKALPPTEIIPKGAKFFDYKAKYTAGATHEITPARLTPEQRSAIQEAAVKAHKVVGAKGMSRSDFMLSEDNTPYILEINTIPGLTQTSLLPQQAKAEGIGFPELLGLIIRAALR